ncbi:hypothetical protein ACFL0R_06695 [Pseudomonadota bacterium]
MQTFKFLMRNLWIPLLAICFVSFVPLALQVDMVGGIPSWAYWTLSLYLTLLLVAWAIVGSAHILYRSYTKKPAPRAASKAKPGSMGHGGAVASGV